MSIKAVKEIIFTMNPKSVFNIYEHPVECVNFELIFYCLLSHIDTHQNTLTWYYTNCFELCVFCCCLIQGCDDMSSFLRCYLHISFISGSSTNCESNICSLSDWTISMFYFIDCRSILIQKNRKYVCWQNYGVILSKFKTNSFFKAKKRYEWCNTTSCTKIFNEIREGNYFHLYRQSFDYNFLRQYARLNC